MRILAIETSCDETAVALLEITGLRESPNVKILGNSLFSQSHLHEQYGGVYPDLAKREHQKNLPILLEKTLKDSSTNNLQETINNIDYIAVTQGPGLEPALWTGITFAEELGKKWQKPVIPVDHMEGHIYSVLYQDKFSIFNFQFSKLEMPALALLVSGGHTELVLVKDFGVYEILGKTRDDAVGEAFDKVARMLGLSYPGGPKISKLAEMVRGKDKSIACSRSASGNSRPIDFSFPRPMINSDDFDFSYSGLKTAVLYWLQKHPIKTEEDKENVACAFEDAAVEVLVKKTRKALNQYSEIKTFILGGGVAANTFLKKQLADMLQEFPSVTLRTPQKELSTDNAIMIGLAAYIRIKSGTVRKNQEIRAKGNLALGV